MKKFLFLIFFFSAFCGWSQVNDLIIARNTGKYTLSNGDSISVFGFTRKLKEEVKIPGPTLYYNQGEQVTLDLWNVSQGAPHTIHLHGLDVNQANDGVPHLSFDVGHMKHGYYHFTAPHAGTYLYHCHVVSTIHVQAGMYGLIIVRPSDGSYTTWNGGHSYHKEISWMSSEVDTNWHTDEVLDHDHDTANMKMRIKIPEYHPQHFLVNGLSEHQLTDSTVVLESSVNEVLYLRIANIGYYGNKIHFPPAYNCRIISSDGRPLPTEEISDSLIILPGERYSILLKGSANFQDSVSFSYFNLNTGKTINTQWIPATVDGYFNVKEDHPKELKVYPNPATKQLSLETSGFEPTDWKIYNVMGVELKMDIIKNGESGYRAFIAQIPTGIYYIQAITREEIIRTTIVKH